MQVFTLTELRQLSVIELYDLAARITKTLPHLPEASPVYTNALVNLRNIRRVLAGREPTPG